MRILLDENLPHSLTYALREFGHETDPVNGLLIKGIDDNQLYNFVAPQYDLCFTRDAGFVHNVRQMKVPVPNKLVRVTLPQQPARLFVATFVTRFRETDWSSFEHCGNWP